MSGAFLPIFFIRNITEYYNAVILTGFSDGFLYILLSGGEDEVAAGVSLCFYGIGCAVFLDDEEGVTWLEMACAVGDYVAVAAADHHDEAAWGELHVAQGGGFGEMVGGEGEGLEGGWEFVSEFYAEVFIVRVVGGDQVETAGGCDYCGALDEQGEDGDEEYDIEDLSGSFYSGDYGVGGEDDGDGSAKAYPGDEGFGAKADFVQWGEGEEYAQGASDEDHEDSDEEGDGGYVDHLMGVDEEAEHEEDHDLCEPCHAVEKFGDAAVVGEGGVAKDYAADVDGEIAVAGEGCGDGEGEEHGSDHEDGDH